MGELENLVGVHDGWLKNTVISVRPSLFKDYCVAGLKLSLNDIFVWSLRAGYQEKEYTKKMLDSFRNAKVDCVCKHNSGHAYMNDISNFIKALQPTKVIPIHTLSRESFKGCFGSQLLDLKNGETISL